jgi:single-strand DNA-binding protein
VADFNRIIMIGNLTRDPELRQLPSGQNVCRLSIASNRQFKNRQSGQMIQEVCYIDVDVWGAQAESTNQYLKKGRPVLIEGRLKLDSWKDAEGQSRSKHSIVADRVVFLGSSQSNEVAEGAEEGADITAATMASGRKAAMPSAAPSTSGATGGSALFKDEPPFEDDLPF